MRGVPTRQTCLAWPISLQKEPNNCERASPLMRSQPQQGRPAAAQRARRLCIYKEVAAFSVRLEQESSIAQKTSSTAIAKVSPQLRYRPTFRLHRSPTTQSLHRSATLPLAMMSMTLSENKQESFQRCKISRRGSNTCRAKLTFLNQSSFRCCLLSCL